MNEDKKKEELMIVKFSKFTLLFIILFLASSVLLSNPTFYGTKGIYRTYAAKPTEMGYLTFGLHGDYAYSDIANSDSARHFGNINTFLGYAPINFFELALNAQIQMRYYNRPKSEDVYNFAFKSLRPIIKIGFPVFADPVNHVGFNLGASGFMNIPWQPIESSDSQMVAVGFIGTVPRDLSFGGLFLADLDFNVMSLHFNLGYEGPANFKNDSIPSYIINTFSPLIPENRFLWGIGFEILTGPYVKFLFEAVGKHCDNAMDTVFITPGIRFITPVGVTIDLGADFVTTSDMDFVPDYDSTDHVYINQRSKWRVFFGITSSSAIFAKPPPPPKATIVGKIIDSETSDPLGATISFPGSDLKSITSNPETGLYKIVVDPGIYRFHVIANGYKWVEKPIRVVKGQTEVVDFTLSKKKEPIQPEKKQGILTGKVISSKEKKPLQANVTIVEVDKKIVTDASTGVYKVTLEAGTYTVKAEANNYVINAKPGVVVIDKETTIQNFELTEKIVKGQVITLRGIYFDTGKSTIRPESYPVLDDAVKVLQANTKVIVEIAGHTDSVGSNSYNMRLSEARAYSVRSFLISRGIPPNRLLARGYGETMPIASNATRDGRQMNRRIEFRVLSD
ncbi:OmpA family protein [candidate division WOR-3 bacterium]|nr:OmpA family protein [candidate division WOR-3 bacterium]